VSFTPSARVAAVFSILFRVAESSNWTPPLRFVIDRIGQNELSYDELLPDLSALGLNPEDAEELVDDLLQSHVLVTGEPPYEPAQIPRADFPLQSLVMNLTNQCNLVLPRTVTNIGEDKVATPEGKPKFMDLETAKVVGGLLCSKQSAGRRAGAHHVLWGRDTLMNFPAVSEGGGGLRQLAAPRRQGRYRWISA
jgi:uncharacterized protein